MRLLNLQVDSYGIFNGREFDFGSGRFQLICGSNEAGKSTLLQLIRETLFGFPHLSAYRLFDDGEMAATADLELADGRKLRFRRRKGRKDTVVGTLETAAGRALGDVDDEGLLKLLGASQPLFQSVFAFSLEELSAGQKSLEQSQLTEALFGGAIGGLSRFQSLQSRLQDDAKELFSPRATKKKINLLLKQIDDLQRQLQDTAARPADFEQLLQRRQEHQRQIERLTDRLAQLSETWREDQRMCDAWAPFVKLQQLRRQQTTDGKLTLTAEQWDEAEQLHATMRQLKHQTQQQEDAIARRKSLQSKLSDAANDEILSQQSRVQTLLQDTGKMQEFAEQLPTRQRELEEASQRVRDRLRELGLDTLRLEQIPADRQLQTRLLDAARQLNDKRWQLDEAHRNERQRQIQLRDVEQELLAAGADEVDAQSGVHHNRPADWNEWEDDWDGMLDPQPAHGGREREADRVKEADAGLVGAEFLQDAELDDDDFLSSQRTSRAAEMRSGKLPADSPADAPDVWATASDVQLDEPDNSHPAEATWESLDELRMELEDDLPESLAAVATPRLSDEQKQRLDQLVADEPDDLRVRMELATAERGSRDALQAAAEVEQQMRALGPEWDWSQAPADPGELSACLREWPARRHELRLAEQRIEELDDDAEQLRKQLAKHADHAPPDDQRLRQLRARRDEAWKLLRLHFVEQSPQQEATDRQFGCAPDELATQLSALMAVADEAADIRQDQASLVAELSALRQALQASQQQRANALLRRQAVEQELNRLVERWRNAWPGGPQPGDEQMLAWFKLREQRDEARVRAMQWQDQAETLHESAERYAQRLRAALHAEDDQFADHDTLRVELRERLRRHDRWQDRREHLELRRHELIAQRDEAARDGARLAASLRQAELVWLDLRERMRLPESWQPEVVSSRISELNAARIEADQHRQLEKQVAAMQRDMDDFRQRVDRIAGESGTDRNSLEVLHQLTQRVEAARESKQQLSASKEEDQRLADELQRLKLEASRADQRWLELRSAAGAESDDVFIAGLKGATTRHQLLAAESEVYAALGCEDTARRDVLLSHLESSSEAELLRRRDESAQRVRQQQAELNQLHKSEGAMSDQLQRLDGSDRALAVEMERQSALAELSEAVDRWAPMMLATELMNQALKQFERDHQPALLADVARLFQRMTGGEYVEVRRQLDDQGTLQVVGRRQDIKTPAELSTGAREQLYLAIRLAYIRQYCRQAEPLPLVMDDVLVNFDEQRARATVEVLLELAEEVQILFLTCHQTTARLVQEQCPQSRPLLLSRNPDETLEHWMGESPQATRQRRRRPPGKEDASRQGTLFN